MSATMGPPSLPFEEPTASASLQLMLAPRSGRALTRDPDHDDSTWAVLVGGFFGETALSRTGAALRVLLLFGFMGALVTLLVFEIVSQH
jgi:hypothetical protein